MEKNEFNEKIKKYYSLNEQLKKMNKIKKKINEELKEEIKNRNKYKFSIVGHRVVMDKKTKVSPDNPEIKKLILENNKKIGDYYKETEYFTLSITKIEKTLKMESINE